MRPLPARFLNQNLAGIFMYSSLLVYSYISYFILLCWYFSLFNYGLRAVSSVSKSTKRSSYCNVLNWSRNPRQFAQPEDFPSLQTTARFLSQRWARSTQRTPRKTWTQITCLNTLFSNTHRLFSSFRINDQDLHAYKGVQSANLHSDGVHYIHLKERKLRNTAFG